MNNMDDARIFAESILNTSQGASPLEIPSRATVGEIRSISAALGD
jgi:hypothetical protein